MRFKGIIIFSCWMIAMRSMVAVPMRMARSTVFNIDCKTTETLCSNLTCIFERNVNGTALLTFGCTLLQTYYTAYVRIRSLTLNGRAKPTLAIEKTLDFCKISEGAGHPLINTFVPGFYEQLSTVLHPCPYSDRFMVTNFPIPELTFPLFGAKNIKHQTDILFLDKKYYTVFSLHIFEVTK